MIEWILCRLFYFKKWVIQPCIHPIFIGIHYDDVHCLVATQVLTFANPLLKFETLNMFVQMCMHMPCNIILNHVFCCASSMH
jgi:hypothetical protein